NAWLSLNLEEHYAHPLNRGWLDVFHRWTNARTVRKLWPILRSEFSRSFAAFCERELGMRRVDLDVHIQQIGQKDVIHDSKRFFDELGAQILCDIGSDETAPSEEAKAYWNWRAWLKDAQAASP